MSRIGRRRQISRGHGPQKIAASELQMGQEVKMPSGRYAFVSHVTHTPEARLVEIGAAMGGRAQFDQDDVVTVRRGGGRR